MRKTDQAKQYFLQMKINTAQAATRSRGVPDQVLGVASMLESSSAGLYYLADALKDVYDKLEQIEKKLPRS